MKLIPADIAYKYGVLPFALQGSTLAVAMADPSNIFAIDDIKFLTGYRIEAYAAPEDTLRGLLSSYYDRAGPVKEGISSPTDLPVQAIAQEAATALPELKTHGEQVPVISLVNSMLNDAINRGASDIHIEPYEHMLRVRFRIDGVLYDVMNPSVKLKNAILSRIKIIARLDIAERRVPQDGKFRMELFDREIDFRLSVLPAVFGGDIVIRVLDKSSITEDFKDIRLDRLGMSPSVLMKFRRAVREPYGMVLMTGPTGSGKTTTLYAALAEINNGEEKIVTMEDPVEYHVPLVTPPIRGRLKIISFWIGVCINESKTESNVREYQRLAGRPGLPRDPGRVYPRHRPHGDRFS